jgi:hypothetical protein
MLAVVISIDLMEIDGILRVEGPRAAEPAARRNAERAGRLRRGVRAERCRSSVRRGRSLAVLAGAS